MTVPVWIRNQVVPISIALVVLAIGIFFFGKMPPPRTSGEIVQWFLILTVICFVFSILPALAILYGWRTGNRAGAFLAGAFPLPAIAVSAYFLLHSTEVVFVHVDSAIFIVILSAICGLAGYCAAWRTKNFLALSIVLTGMWLIIWMWSFN
jgi:hypothetical protein